MDVRVRASAAIGSPPATIDDPPLTVDEASALMADFGFVAFRTPPGDDMPDSCLMVLIRERPTFQHFDPEVVTYWTMSNGHGRPATIDRGTGHSGERSFSWGRIQVSDRLGVRNSFVTFGGQLRAENVGPGALLVIFRSPAPILRLQGHSQHADRLAEEAMAFFGRLVPKLWSPDVEAGIGRAPPEVLWASFLLDERERLVLAHGRLDGVESLPLWPSLRKLASERPDVLAAARRVLQAASMGTAPGELVR
ncbi:MAG TPA: hypothetical protein VFP30_00820 [Candidatus Limnocylindria bacterium]|nr:hypothetical protein [Candidatus Limnocylindria bacterium]